MTLTLPVSFWVDGKPETAGSKRGFVLQGKDGARRAILVDANPETKTWQGVVRTYARAAYGGPPVSGPIRLKVSFFMPRTKGHMDKDGEIKKGAPFLHSIRPDALKLTRAVEDALTNIVYADDAQISSELIQKRYSLGRVGVLIEVSVDGV